MILSSRVVLVCCGSFSWLNVGVSLFSYGWCGFLICVVCVVSIMVLMSCCWLFGLRFLLMIIVFLLIGSFYGF